MSYCVYTHTSHEDGSIFYVGAGVMNRPYNKGNRSLMWKGVAARGYSIQVVATYPTREQALRHEARLISKLQPACNGVAGNQHPEFSVNPGRITFPLRVTDEELATLRRRANASGLSMQKFAKYMVLDGSLPKKSK